MKKLSYVLLLMLFGVYFNILHAQKTFIYKEPVSEYQKGLELFSKEKYNAAEVCFLNTIDAVNDKQSDMRINSEYYAAVCAIELYNSDAEYLMKKFISNHPENIKVKMANFQLAKLLYRQLKWGEAIKRFETIDKYDLSSSELSEYYFKTGYCYFMLKSFDKSKKQFTELLDVDSKYSAASNYYYSQIAYDEKNFDTALKGFLKIEKDKYFGPIVPYYIAQIYYLQGKYSEVIQYAPALLDSAKTVRVDEISRILGESYFKTGNYTSSIQFLEKYRAKTKSVITRQDNYELGYAYYKCGLDYESAVDYFGKVTSGVSDSLTQNTYYLLGDCYLKTGNKKFAMNSFQSASKLSFYPDIKEDALFNYAKLAYDLSLNPYNEAIKAFEKYINTYPTSAKIDEAHTCLVNLYFTTKNYKDALASIEKIKNRDDKLNQAYQKIAYYRGIELFNNKDIEGAIELFNKSNSFPLDKSIKAQCIYWKGEAFYRLAQYDSARTCYNTFMILPGAYSLPYYNTSEYDIGYCYFKQKDYKEAIKDFRKFLKGNIKDNPKLISDAYLRIADCYLISKEYSNAEEYYDKAIALKSFDVDYAMFQEASCLGVQGKYDKEISVLQSLLDDYPRSAYADDARFELANTYLVKNDNENALLCYNSILKDFPNGNYVKKALLKIGLIYYNSDKDDLALQAFKKVVTDYPATNESKDALVSIRNIYMTMDKVDSFYVYVKSLPFEYGSKTEQDSVTYMASETKYMNGDCEKATKGFNNYIQQFPTGYFVTNAYFYKAECDNKNNDSDDAIKEYSFVAGAPQNKFSESALLHLADICYKLKRYDSAANYYNRLEGNSEFKTNIIEARTMEMRCYWKAGKYSNAIKAANILIATEKVSNEALAEAHITIARSALAIDSIPLAQTEFEFTFKQSPASEYGAESKYNIAYIYFKLKDYKQSEKTVFEVINQVPSYDYWIAKSFILLADIYVVNGNTVQAKATLQSIIDNYEGSDLVTIAHQKLNAINDAEKLQQQQQKAQQEDIQIKFDNNPKNDTIQNNNKPMEEKKNE